MRGDVDNGAVQLFNPDVQLMDLDFKFLDMFDANQLKQTVFLFFTVS